MVLLFPAKVEAIVAEDKANFSGFGYLYKILPLTVSRFKVIFEIIGYDPLT